MKKALIFSLIFSATVFAALKDGVYTESVNQKKGETVWTSKLEVTVKGGKIVEAKLDDFNDKGEKKIDNKKYNEKWLKANNMTYEKFVNEFSAKLIETQDVSKIDTIVGATGSTKQYKDLAKKVLQQAK